MNVLMASARCPNFFGREDQDMDVRELGVGFLQGALSLDCKHLGVDFIVKIYY